MLVAIVTTILSACSVTVATSAELSTQITSGTTTLPAGGTLCIRGGTYLAPTSGFVVTLAGTRRRPYFIRSTPGEWAVLYVNEENQSTKPAVIDMQGSYTELHDVSVVDISTDRETTCGGGCANPAAASVNRPTCIRMRGHHNRAMHNVAHDCGVGISGFDTAATITGLEAYGNVVFNNGWDDTAIANRGQSFYWKHDCTSDCRRHAVRNNIAFHGFNGIMQLSGQGAHVDNVVIADNVFFLGTVGSRDVDPDSAAQIVLNTETHPIVNVKVLRNKIYTKRSDSGACDPDTPECNMAWFGIDIWPAVTAGSMEIKDNYWTGLGTYRKSVASMTITGNTVRGRLNHGLGGDPTPWSIAFDFDSSGSQNYATDYASFAAAYPSNDFSHVPPVTSVGSVLLDDYDRNRCTVVIYNWAGTSTVSVNPSTCLVSGDSYSIVNAQNVYAGAVVTGTYTGSAIAFPMTGLTSLQPISTQSDHVTEDEVSGDDFNVFLLFKAGSQPPYSKHGLW